MASNVKPGLSLTLSMLLLTVSVGSAVWFVTDYYQQNVLNQELTERLKDRFKQNAMQQRVRFDQYVKSFNPGVRLYASSVQLKRYVREADWIRDDEGLVKHQNVPEWAPSMSSMRQFIMPRYMILLDRWGKTREIYHANNPLPPKEMIAISSLVLELSIGQSFLTMFGDSLYLIASENVSDSHGNIEATLLITSPIDQQFMFDSQGAFFDESIFGLVQDDDKIYVSSAPDRVAAGTDIAALSSEYLVTKAAYFDSGSADIIIRFFSLMSTKSLQEQIDKLIAVDRKVSAITAIMFIVSFLLIMLWVVSRIRRLNRNVISFSNDIDIPVPDVNDSDELKELENRFRLLANAVQSEKSALEHQASHDSLTGIANRSYFDVEIENVLQSNGRSSDRFALLICDLNKFKQVNDTYGHQVGDEVIKIASKRLISCTRADDVVARMGGDEFALILKNVGKEEVETVANKIISCFQEPTTVERRRLDVGISIGAALYPRDGVETDKLMKNADLAMYRAKRQKCLFAFYTEEDSKTCKSNVHLLRN